MTLVELLEAIANGESSFVEFKRDTIEAHDLAKEMVGFANLDGGKILLGVEDDGTISGVTRNQLEEFVMNAARDLIRPPLIPGFEIIRDVELGLAVAVVHVDGFAVHGRWRNNRLTYFMRVGSTTREASPEELQRLFQRRGAIRGELRPVVGAGLAALDRRRLTDYFRIRTQIAPEIDDLGAWERLLVNTELLVESDEGPEVTVAGLLLFGKNPERYLPHCGVDAVAYRGQAASYDAMERVEIRGPLVHSLAVDGTVDESGVVGRTLEFVRRNTRSTSEVIDGIRVDRPEYPEAVVREAVVNALVHRDWLLAATSVQLSIFENRIEVTSPGSLPNGVNTDRMLAGVRAARNQLLKDVMRDYQYLEHMGMGVPLVIVRGMAEHNGTSPELMEDREGERFTVRLYSMARNDGEIVR